MDTLRGKCAIAGAAETEAARVPGVTAMSHSLQAAKKAIEDGGLSNRDIDGVLTPTPECRIGMARAFHVQEARGLG